MKNYIRVSILPEYAKETGMKKDTFFFFDDADDWHRTQAYEFLVFEVDLKTDFGMQIHFGAECTLTIPVRGVRKVRDVKRRSRRGKKVMIGPVWVEEVVPEAVGIINTEPEDWSGTLIAP